MKSIKKRSPNGSGEFGSGELGSGEFVDFGVMFIYYFCNDLTEYVYSFLLREGSKRGGEGIPKFELLKFMDTA